jgi:hypothetical protein
MASMYQKFKEVDFEVEKEVWNRYELDDGSMIKMRTILVKLLAPRIVPIAEAGAPRPQQFEARFQNIVAVIKALDENMGPPSGPISPQEMGSLPKIEVGYTPFAEDWNVYRLPDGSKLKVKLVVSSVSKVKDRYDQDGYPLYIVQSTNAIVPIPRSA